MAGAVGDLIFVVNELHDVFGRSRIPLDLELPQIVVVGGQSAGKSSVLESFVERDFLPRGSGIVTRCPIILQLRNSKEEQETAELLLPDGKINKFKDLKGIKEALLDQTKEIAGDNKGISKQPIRLKIFSDKVLDFTLVDLPGLTKVPVGDQPQDIDKQVEDLVNEYVKQENTLILAVSPANQDLDNSDALKVARRVDPEGERTIGVITKLDLMDAGTDARDILENNIYPLKFGYVGVVNRSQKDINKNTSMQSSRDKERNFFNSHSSYRTIAREQGSEFLQKKLNKILQEHIAKKLPDLKESLMKKFENLNTELISAGVYNIKDDTTAGMLELIEKFKSNLKCALEGHSTEINENQIEGGALINESYNITLAEMLNEIELPSVEKISTTIANMHGYRNSLWVPQLAFESVMKNLILQFKQPLNRAVQMISCLLKSITQKQIQMLKATPVLQQKVTLLLNSFIDQQETVTKKTLMLFVDAECSYMNTSHPCMKHIEYRKNQRKLEQNAEASGDESECSGTDDENEVFSTTSGKIEHQVDGEKVRRYEGHIFLFQEQSTKELRLMVNKQYFDESSQRYDFLTVFNHNVPQYIKMCDDDLENREVQLIVRGFPQTDEEERLSIKFYRAYETQQFKESLNKALNEYKQKNREERTKETIEMARVYAKIVVNNVKDQAMKYMSLLMISETISYVSVNLTRQLLKGDIDSYVTLSADMEMKIEMMKVYEEGQQILKKCLFFG